MYVDSSSITVNQKTYTRHLLRTSFRKDGKVKHRTIANISSCSDEEIQAVKLGLKYKGNLAELASLDKSRRCCTALAESEIRLWWWPRYVRA